MAATTVSSPSYKSLMNYYCANSASGQAFFQAIRPALTAIHKEQRNCMDVEDRSSYYFMIFKERVSQKIYKAEELAQWDLTAEAFAKDLYPNVGIAFSLSPLPKEVPQAPGFFVESVVRMLGYVLMLTQRNNNA